MRRTDVVSPMLDLHERLKALPEPGPRGFYTGAQLAQALGRTPRHTDAQVLRLLGWLRVARVVNKKLARVWIPPTHAWAVLKATPT